MRVTVLSILVGAFGMVPKDLEKKLKELEIRGRIETIQIQNCWDHLKYLEESWRPNDTCCHLDFNERPLANTGGKNSWGTNDIILISEFFTPVVTDNPHWSLISSLLSSPVFKPILTVLWFRLSLFFYGFFSGYPSVFPKFFWNYPIGCHLHISAVKVQVFIQFFNFLYIHPGIS